MVSTMSEYRIKRALMIEYLGGACATCGVSENLQFDHVDRKTKAFNVAENWARSWTVLRPELDKCQLLCPPHHREKSYEAGDLPRPRECGTDRKYRNGCRCDPCREAHRIEGREYRRRRAARRA